MIDDTNQITDYNRYQTRVLRTYVQDLSPGQKEALLNEIQVRKGVHTLTDKPFNQEVSKYIEKLLEKK